MISESIRDVLREQLLESKDWPDAPKELSAKQLSTMSLFRKKFDSAGQQLTLFVIKDFKDKVFLHAPSLSVPLSYMSADGSVRKVSDAHIQGKNRVVIKHKDDIKKEQDDIRDEKKFMKDLEDFKKARQERSKSGGPNVGIYKIKGLSRSAQYKWDGKKWYRWDGSSKWIRHTRKKGHPTAADLTNDRELGRLEKQKG